MTMSALFARVAEDIGVKPIVVSRMLKSLQKTIAHELLASGSIRVHALACFRMREKPPREAGLKRVFGKEILVEAKPGSIALRVSPTKALKDAVKQAQK